MGIQDGFGIIHRRQHRMMERVQIIRRRKDMLYVLMDELIQTSETFCAGNKG